MMDYFKHTASNNVLSYFNPILSLKPQLRNIVNAHFVVPIVECFFKNKGSIDLFEPLDTDLLKSNIDFDRDINFVKRYLYKHIVDNIWKDDTGSVGFKVRFVVTFDEELTPKIDDNNYPYEQIFHEHSDFSNGKEFKIRYGLMTLGKVPVLYFIRLHLPTLIRFLKLHSDKASFDAESELSSDKQMIDMSHRALQEVKREMMLTSDQNRLEDLRLQEQTLSAQLNSPMVPLQGRAGQLRINLQWNTIDDLDLHVIDPGGNEICYSNKEAICQDKVGLLDVDANASNYTTNPPPQENISWEVAPSGEYRVFVVLFKKRESIEKIPFTVQVMGYNSIGSKYAGTLSSNKEKKNIVEFKYSKDMGLYDFEKLV